MSKLKHRFDPLVKQSTLLEQLRQNSHLNFACSRIGLGVRAMGVYPKKTPNNWVHNITVSNLLNSVNRLLVCDCSLYCVIRYINNY